VKEAGLNIRWNANAGINHFKAQFHVRLALPSERDFNFHFPFFGELDRIAQEVEEDLLEAPWIAPKVLRYFGWNGADEFNLLAVGETGKGGERRLNRFHQIEVDGFYVQLARFNLGKIQNVVDDREEAFGAQAGAFCIFVLVPIQRGIEQQVDHAKDAVHGRADLMAHGGEKVRHARRLRPLLWLRGERWSVR